ncbi:MAG: PDZ domain-containing protein [Bacteroidetes bacterium]|nr:PDZ domain-containing protein [Bacteroidota bacterium]
MDFTHGFVSGSGVFMFVPELKNGSGNLTVHPHQTFKKVSTGLPKSTENVSSDNAFNFTFKDYDQLVDCPIEIGNQVEFDFTAAGVKHTVAIYGEGNYDVSILKEDMKIIVENATKVFGENPNKDYTFIIHNVVDAQGGLEHCNSTTLSVNRWTYQGNEYLDFLSLVAHEYFHLWNVKRIRPIELGPFDYDKENYTTLLWVMEGFTSYYDELLMLRSGYYSQEQYIQKLNNSLNYVEGSTGSRVQPLSHSSYDAWIKAYRPNENSPNTTMTYYSRGQLMAAIFDAMIVYETKGQNCLDDFLKALYEKFHKKLNRGFTVDEFKLELEKWTNQNLTEFWSMYIDGTEIPDYKVYFSRVGLNVDYIGKEEASFGARFSDRNGKTMVQTVRSNSTAEAANLSPGDEIIAVEGFRVNSNRLSELLESIEIGDTFKMLIARDEILYELSVTMNGYEQPKFSLSLITTSMEKMLRDFWLR